MHYANGEHTKLSFEAVERTRHLLVSESPLTFVRRHRLLMLILTAAGCAAPNLQTRGTLVQDAEVQALLSSAYRAMAAEQLAELLGLYTEDAIIQSSGEPPVVGKRAIERFWSETFSRFRVALMPTIEECTVIAPGVVIVRGRALGTFAPKQGGPPIAVDSWFLQVYRRDAHGHLHFFRGANGPTNPHP